MRIATYNVWNSSENTGNRLSAAVEELVRVDADLVALQEVPTHVTNHGPVVRMMIDQTGYESVTHYPYPERPERGELAEGLTILSKYPIDDWKVNWSGGRNTNNNWAVTVEVSAEIGPVRLTNLHLDWRSVKSRETELLSILESTSKESFEGIQVLCGDFNDRDRIFDFLEGSVNIGERSEKWFDVVRIAYEAKSVSPPPTLDFATNPRWKNKQPGEVPARSDRIYMRDSPAAAQVQPTGADLFGKEPLNSAGIVPSDHYGVYVDLSKK